MGLLNQIAIVTGGGQGLGRQIALRLAQEGSQVVIADINEEGSRETAEMIDRNGDGAPKVIPTDIRQENQVTALIQAALSIAGRIDILVNNSGIMGPVKPIEDITVEEWEDTLAVNLRGMFLCCKHTIPPMKKQGSGSIVNISSIAGKLALVQRTPYATSKMGVIGLTRTLAREWARFGIGVNCVAPGAVRTQMTAAIPERIMDGLLHEIPFGRLAEPEEVASVHLFLASAMASYVTGQVLLIDGGLKIGV